MSRSRVIVVVFTVTACLIFTIHLRISSSRVYNRYRSAIVEQKALKQQLWQKQLRFECLINPAGIPKQSFDQDDAQ